MEKINDINNFFDKYIFEEHLIFSFSFQNNDFTIVVEDPLVSEKLRSSGKANERGFIKLVFNNVQDFSRNKGVNKLYDIEDFYNNKLIKGTLDVRELTVAFNENMDKVYFFLDLGISYGDVSFSFEEVYVAKKLTYYKKINNSDLYFETTTNKEIDFYNPFDIDY